MEFHAYYILLDVCIVFYGIRGLLNCAKMFRAKALLPSRLVLPGDCTVESCPDPEGYYRHILPRASLFSLVNFLCGLLNLLAAFFPAVLPEQTASFTIPVFLLGLLWFGLSLSRAIKRFWR